MILSDIAGEITLEQLGIKVVTEDYLQCYKTGSNVDRSKPIYI